MSYQTIIFEKNENYALITLNRPEKLNALNKQLFDDLNDALLNIELDPSIRFLVLTGSGEKAFAAGADIKELHESNKESGRIFSEYGSKVMERLASLKIPTLAAVNGFALGGGCELAMACHMRFASDKAKLGQPEVNLGILPGYGGTQRLTRLVGTAKSMELNISAKIIGADEAKSIGLVNEVYPHEELMDKTMEFVNLVLSKAPLAVSGVVDTVMAAEKLSPSEGLAYESKIFGDICGTEDFKEGTKAFIEKRDAQFSGK